MNATTVIEGIQQFSARAGSTLRRASDVLFEARFEGEQYQALIGIEGLDDIAMTLSYATACGELPGTSLAPTLLMRNRGGVESTCFYFSVHVNGGKPWLFLEARQFLASNSSADDIADLLGMWRLQSVQAREALRR